MRWVPVAAVTTLSLLATACSKPATPAAESSDTTAAASAPAAPAPTDEEKLKLLASLPAPYNTGDLANGKAKFALCQSCHTIAEGGANMTGPNLHGVFGRKAASVEGFNYSDALKAAGYTWDPDHLNNWLEAPMKALPGTKMSFAGLKDPKDRTDVIAYLMTETGYKPK